ncbi:MAG: ABC transporter ATP-binding protein [Candidatus Zipacnadales bacterium]
MRELLRLRHFAPHLGLLCLGAALGIFLTAALRVVAVYQLDKVIEPALGVSKGKTVQQEGGGGAGGALQRVLPGPTRVVGRWVEGIQERWQRLFRAPEATTTKSLQRRLLLAACTALVLVGTLSMLTEMVAVFLTQYIGDSVLRGVRQRLFEHLQSLPLSFFENHRAGDLLSRISNDTTVLQVLFTAPLASMLEAPPTCLGMIALMLILNWRLSLVVFILLPFIALFTSWLGARLKRQSRNVQRRMADLVSFVEQTLGGMRVVQAFGMEPLVNRLFGEINTQAFRTAIRADRLRAINVPVAGMVLVIGVAIALMVGGNEIIEGRMKDASDLFTFVFAMQLLGTQVAKVVRLNLTVQQGSAACGRIWEILDTPSQLTDAPDAIELTDLQGHIAFRNVGFAYDEASGPVLHDINLEIKPGETVAIAGPSGAGKSTLANLVPRLYDVTSGVVLIDGIDVRKVTRASLRSLIGIVPQETVLFGTTVRENIAYGRPGATEQEIIAAAEAAQAHAFITALPNGYDTEIGERGVKLSGGQRQRLAIARALLRDPRILILDEATSSLDAESEKAVQRAISTLLQGRTALIIAHRLSTIRDADRIVVLESGRIVEEGSHEQLMAQGGLYRALYETQLRTQHTEESVTYPL